MENIAGNPHATVFSQLRSTLVQSLNKSVEVSNFGEIDSPLASYSVFDRIVTDEPIYTCVPATVFMVTDDAEPLGLITKEDAEVLQARLREAL